MSPRHLLARAVAVALAATSVSLLPTSAEAAYPVCRGVPLIAHRGMADRSHTENTVRAFTRANAYGASLIETDARISADGQWVLMHDPTVDRTTRGTGTAEAMTLAQLKSLRTNDGVVGGVPTLTTALWLVRRWPRMRMQIEIKSYGVPTDRLKSLADAVRAYGVTKRVSVTSYSPDTLARLRQVAPAISTGLVTRVQVSSQTVRSVAGRVLINRRSLSRAFVQVMHAAGVQVDTWTVNSRRAWRHAVRSGVDTILTNSPPRLRKLCGRR